MAIALSQFPCAKGSGTQKTPLYSPALIPEMVFYVLEANRTAELGQICV